MAQPKDDSTKPTLTKSIETAICTIREALEKLESEGDFQAIDQIVRKLAPAVGFPVEALSGFAEMAQACIERQRANFSSDLKQVAEQAGCDVRNRSPYISVGCVKFKEKKEGEWSVSVLDNVVLETIRTHSGRRVAEHALKIIKEIDAALARSSTFMQDLLFARDAIRGPNGDPIPANLAMVLCSHGRAL